MVRLFAVGLFIVSIEGAVTLFYFKAIPELEAKLLPYIASIIGIILSLLLWVFPIAISKNIHPINTKKYSHRALSLNELYSLGFVLLGAFLLFNVFSDLIYWFSLLVLETEAFDISFGDLSIVKKASVVTTLFEFFFAIIFIFNRKLYKPQRIK